MRAIGIVATIGPVSAEQEALRSLRDAGMTVARLNGSHANLAWHQATIELIRKAVPDIPILLDIPGRKIRTIQLAHEPSFVAGGMVILTTDLSHDGSKKVPVNFEHLHERITEGTRIYADDGTIAFTVDRVHDRDIWVRALNSGKLRSRKGINVPGVDLGRDLVTDRDIAMLEFAKANEVDYIGISFVESPAHVDSIRSMIDSPVPRIVAKVENGPGLANVDDIASVADAIMIDRGDLAVETTLEGVAVFQKQILAACNRLSKPVIVATELLHSMIDSPNATKAEISDITNAVLDGASLLMLSGETAIGQHAVAAVTRLSRTSSFALRHQHHENGASAKVDLSVLIEMLGDAWKIDKVVLMSTEGGTLRAVVPRLRVAFPVIAVNHDRRLARAAALVPGVRSVTVNSADATSSRDIVEHLLKEYPGKLLTEGDAVLLVDLSEDGTSASSFQIVQL